MRRMLTVFVAMAVLFPGSSFADEKLEASSSSQLNSAFEVHCIKCHGQGGKVKGKVDLLKIQTNEELQEKPELLEKLIAVLDDREMPPRKEPALPAKKRERMVTELRSMLDRSSRERAFGRTPIRRMNRFEYNNAVVDLLELDRDIFALNERLMRRRSDYFRPATRKMPAKVRVTCRPLAKDIDNQRPEGFRGVAAFPQDKRAEHGFDNRADHLSLSPLLMESFLRLSQTVAESPDLNAKECRSWNRLFAAPVANEGKASADESEEVRSRLSRLLRRAFRRPVDEETLDRFADFAEGQLKSGASFEETMRTVVGAVIGMPDFLYFYEFPTEESAEVKDSATVGRRRVTDFELASRLARFFWSSIPDETLLDLAEAGQLSDPETLSQQVDRMLDDRRTSRFCDNFPAQWLQLDRLITSIPDKGKFPYFYYHGYRTSMHMLSEPLLLFETVFIEDLPILDLLDPKFSWRSQMLNSNYKGHSKGDSQVQVQTFERVKLDDPRQGGVITNAAVMTMTSTATRTQPITRGAWINGVIFNDPPEPPPADVPALPEGDKEALEKFTIRERLAEHRKRADCAGCHDKIDPLGFALENYGPTGVWRDKYENGRDVDPGGVLFNQYKFDSLVEFKALLLKEKHRFVRGFVSHLLSYALSRELGPADSPALDEMAKKALAGKDQLRVVLKRIVLSDPFLHKNTGLDTNAEPVDQAGSTAEK